MIQYLQAFIHNQDPIILLLAVAVLPLFGFPVTLLWIAAGVIAGHWGGFVIVAVGGAINLVLAYLFCRGVLRRPIEAFMHKRGFRIPELQKAQSLQLAIGVSITPGIPLFVQSYLLILAKVPFMIFFSVSWFCHLVYAQAFVMAGTSVFQGDYGLLFAAICLFIGILFLTRVGASLNGRSIHIRSHSHIRSRLK